MNRDNVNKLFVIAGILPMLQLVLGLINPYNYFPLRVNTLFFIAIHIIIYFIIYFFSKPALNKSLKTISYTVDYIEIPAYLNWAVKITFVIELTVFLLTIIFAIRNNLTLQDIRDLYFFGSLYGSEYSFGQIVIFIWLMQGVRLYALLRVCTAFLLRPTKKTIRLFLMISLAFIFNDLSTGGRLNIFYLASLVFIIRYFIGNVNISRYSRKILNISFGITALLVIFVSILRMEENHSLFSFLYKYFIGPVFLFDQASLDSNGIAVNDDLRFGVIFSSLDWAVVGVLKAISFCDCKTLATVIDPIMATGYYFSDSDGGNAFFTGFFSFFLDFGFGFGFLGGVASGVICSLSLVFSLINFFNGQSMRRFFILIVVIFINIMMFRENSLSSPAMLFLLFFIFILTKTKIRSDASSSISITRFNPPASRRLTCTREGAISAK